MAATSPSTSISTSAPPPSRWRQQPIVERERELEQLRAALQEASAGHGSLVFVSGEAGVGKTTVLRECARRCAPSRTLVGSCDPIETPRPHGPLLDIAPELDPEIGERLARDCSLVELFGA